LPLGDGDRLLGEGDDHLARGVSSGIAFLLGRSRNASALLRFGVESDWLSAHSRDAVGMSE
jgi:hypothetical protein